MKSLTKHYEIKAPKSRVWQLLTQPKDISSWGAGPAVMTDQPGTQFSLWGGDVRSQNLEVVKQSKLVQDWISGNWPEPSKVIITLSGSKDTTIVDLVQTNIPDSDASDIDAGWDDFYFLPLKKVAER